MSAGIRLEDVLAIRELTATYNRTFDTGDSDQWLATFVPDGELVVDGEAVLTGRADLASFAEGRAGHFHHVSADPEISIDGDQAVQRCSLVLYQTGYTGTELVGTGRYRDELVRTPEGWRFRRRTVSLRRIAGGGAA